MRNTTSYQNDIPKSTSEAVQQLACELLEKSMQSQITPEDQSQLLGDVSPKSLSLITELFQIFMELLDKKLNNYTGVNGTNVRSVTNTQHASETYSNLTCHESPVCTIHYTFHVFFTCLVRGCQLFSVSLKILKADFLNAIFEDTRHMNPKYHWEKDFDLYMQLYENFCVLVPVNMFAKNYDQFTNYQGMDLINVCILSTMPAQNVLKHMCLPRQYRQR